VSGVGAVGEVAVSTSAEAGAKGLGTEVGGGVGGWPEGPGTMGMEEGAILLPPRVLRGKVFWQ
jgi:hypothetical protein